MTELFFFCKEVVEDITSNTTILLNGILLLRNNEVSFINVEAIKSLEVSRF